MPFKSNKRHFWARNFQPMSELRHSAHMAHDLGLNPQPRRKPKLWIW